MSKSGFVVVAAALGAFGAVAGETVIRRGDALAVSNATDVTEANTLRVLYGARGLDKTGPGAYTLPLGQVDAPNALTVNAYSGPLNVTTEGTLPTLAEPTELLNLASFWLDASVNLQTDENGKILWWYDRRETKTGDAWGTDYVRAKTFATPKNGSGETYEPVLPSMETLEGMTQPMVYFGGYQTGTAMSLYQTNSVTAKAYQSLHHIYAVVNFQQGYGFLIGAGSNGVIIHPNGYSASTGLGASYNSPDAFPCGEAGEFLVNGTRINPMHTPLKKGLQLIEIHAAPASVLSSFTRLFGDRNINGRYGGDYIGELLAYDYRQLTEAERGQVSRYLMQKWGITPAQGTVTVKVGADATVREGDSTRVVYTGRGTITRDGTETEYYRPQSADLKSGLKVRVENGTMQADVRELNLAVKAGDKLALSTDSFDVHTVTSTPDAAAAAKGEAVISGDSKVVRLGRIAPDVSKLTVGATEVVLGDAATGGDVLPKGAVAVPGVATIANGSFESAFSADDWVWVNKAGSSGLKTFSRETDVLDWRIGGDGNNMVEFRTLFRLANFMPTDGSAALLLKQANLFYGQVTVSKDGDYILAFDATGRYKFDNMQLVLSLVDEEEHTNTFACCSLPIGGGYRTYRFVISALKAGNYKLVVDARNGKATFSTSDSHAMLDNFRMESVLNGLSSIGGVPVPNGSFENTLLTASSRAASEFSTNNIVSQGWTLTSPDAPAAWPVAFISRLAKEHYVSTAEGLGEWQLRFRGASGRATTDAFTLPAGRWSLRCKAAKWAFDPYTWNGKSGRTCYPRVGVRVLVNGSEVFDERTDQLSTYEMLPIVFKNVLTVTATDQVVLEVRQAEPDTSGGNPAMLNVDDFEFVPVGTWGSTTELVKNGSFSAGNASSWTVAGEAWLKRPNGGYDIDYGGQQFDDDKAMDLKNEASLSQALTFPAAGVYRLSFWSRARVSYYETGSPINSRSYSGNKLRASWIDGIVTNQIVETPAIFSTNFNQTVALFTVPTAGTYTLRLEGVNNPTTGVYTGGNEKDSNVFIDAISVTAAPQGGAAPELPEKLELVLTGDSKLRLDYVGTNELQRLVIGGRSLVNVIDAATYPELVSGPGAVFVRPKGTVLLFR